MKGEDWPETTAELVQRCRELARIESHLQAYLHGEWVPESNRDWLLLGRICYCHERNLAAARAFRSAFESMEEPGELAMECFYPAAGAAVLAAAGQGPDAAKLDYEARAGWREWAYEILRREFERWKAHPNPAAARNFLARWSRSNDLKWIRDPEYLDALSDREREQWRSYWSELTGFLSDQRK